MQKTRTILLLDDEKEVHTTVAQILEREPGYRLLSAYDFEEARTIARKNAGGIDLLVIDVLLPGAPGTAVVAELNQLVPAARVLMISGMVDAPEMQEAGSFLPKPFTAHGFLKRVRELLE